MDAITANCRLDYFPAFHDSGTREPHDIWWIVMHDEEAPTARSAAAFFKTRAAGGSAHLCVDDQACYRCLPNTAIPWGAASASSLAANTHGFHIEQAGYAKWTGGVWRAKHLRTLNRAAYKAAVHMVKFQIPTQFITADELVAGAHSGVFKRGVTTHAEITAASKRLDPGGAWKYDHTDPGFGWPRRLFMIRVSSYRKGLAQL